MHSRNVNSHARGIFTSRAHPVCQKPFESGKGNAKLSSEISNVSPLHLFIYLSFFFFF